MKTYDFRKVRITGDWLARLQEQNRLVTIPAIYEQFEQTGRIAAFDMNWKQGEPNQPHIFWDSDNYKWIECAAYTLKEHPDPAVIERIEHLIDAMEAHQCEDGYFNVCFQMFEPQNRFTFRQQHELYCAGHLFEAAVAYAEATGRERLLAVAEKYADCIYRAFVTEKTAKFFTPGHEEIELALVKMYRYTGKRKFLDLAAHFINERGTHDEERNDGYHPEIRSDYNQSLVPVREQTEAVGHCVRALYLYTAMADLALELRDEALEKACRALYRDIVDKKMYVTGGLGSSAFGEAFSNPYDLPNEEAYTETCAGIGLMLFMHRMLALENNAAYADLLERAFYNGVLSGVSLDGKAFFYENPLEITMLNHFTNSWGARRYPLTQRIECFPCSCCPPNLARVISQFGNYLFGSDGDTLYVNQFATAELSDDGVRAVMTTRYPVDGDVSLRVEGKSRVAVRIPGWCASFTADAPYTVENGYAVFANTGAPIRLSFDMKPFAVRARSEVVRDAGRLCIQAGPIVYCAESVDNGANLHALAVSPDFEAKAVADPVSGLLDYDVTGWRRKDPVDALYYRAEEVWEPTVIRLIPYRCFANRGECDMLVWLHKK